MPDLNLEKQRFLAAVIFYTRFPVPEVWYDGSKLTEEAIQPTRYFPFIGILIGCLCSLTYVISELIFSKELSILLALGLVVWATGALHEDGLVDSADGFGAGWNAEEIMKIMKDSRVGVYGIITLIFVLFIKFQALLQISSDKLPFIWIAAMAFSRFAAIGFIIHLDYVWESSNKSFKMVSLNQNDWSIAGLCGILPLVLLGREVIPAIIVCFILFLILKQFFKKRLGGVTGDCLGAAQQLIETMFYLVLAIVFTH